MLPLFRLKRRRKDGAGRSTSSSATQDSEDDDPEGQGQEAARERNRQDRRELRGLLGSDYSSDEEAKEEVNEDEIQGYQGAEESDEEDSAPIGAGRTRLRVGEIWALEESLMKRERAAQAARDRALNVIMETLVNQNKMIMEQLARGSVNSSNQD